MHRPLLHGCPASNADFPPPPPCPASFSGGNMVMQQNPDGTMSQVMMPSPNGAYPMHTPPPSHPPYSDMPHMFDSSGGSSGGSSGRKRPRIDGRSPGSGGSGGSGAPRTRLEGRRCAVCAVIKKAGCGTENAHFRCLKRKLPEGAAELERRVGELVDVGQEERVTVWNPREGRKLSGQAAPMLKNLVGWLASHPGWEAHPRGSTPGPRSGEGAGVSCRWTASLGLCTASPRSVCRLKSLGYPLFLAHAAMLYVHHVLDCCRACGLLPLLFMEPVLLSFF